jgi:hypothetical protein
MIDAQAAREAAESALASLLAEPDSLIASWPEAAVGTPVMVAGVTGGPSYWLVPLEVANRAIGGARIDAEARVLTIGLTCREPRRIEDFPRVVTLLTAEEAAAKARAVLEPGEEALPPRFVHDGPPGREAWLIETRRGRQPARWIMVTPGGATVRRAGDEIGREPGVE